MPLATANVSCWIIASLRRYFRHWLLNYPMIYNYVPYQNQLCVNDLYFKPFFWKTHKFAILQPIMQFIHLFSQNKNTIHKLVVCVFRSLDIAKMYTSLFSQFYNQSFLCKISGLFHVPEVLAINNTEFFFIITNV